MYLKIGNFEICNSSTDGMTKAIKTPIPALQKRNDSVHPLGSTNAVRLHRKGSSRGIEVSVIRQFAFYREAIEHMAEMEVFKEHGGLDFESMLGVGYLYGSAALDSVEVADFTRVMLEIRYVFKAGKAITYVALSITEEESGIECLVSMDGGCYWSLFGKFVKSGIYACDWLCNVGIMNLH